VKPKTFWCPHPWETLSAKADGDLRVCCLADYSDPKPVIDENGKKITVGNLKSLDQYYNAPKLKDLRKAMLAGERPEMCRRCWELEDAGGMTERTQLVANRDSQSYFDRVHPQTGVLVAPAVKHIDFAFSNSCNLKCKMCTPWASDQLVKEFNELGLVDKELTFDYKGLWSFDESLRSLISEAMTTLEYFVIVGGEPLINKELLKCLTHISESDHAKHIFLRVTTNLTVLPEQFLEVISKFKGVHFLVSIDAIGDMHNYIRYPSKFDRLERNLSRLLNWENDNFWVEITTCFMSWNLLEFPRILDYFAKYSRHKKMRGWVPWFNYVTGPDYACPEALPQAIRVKANAQIAAAIDHWLPHVDNESDRAKLEMLSSYSKKMIQTQDTNVIRRFLNFSLKQDRLRNIDTHAFMPFIQDDSFAPWR